VTVQNYFIYNLTGKMVLSEAILGKRSSYTYGKLLVLHLHFWLQYIL